MGNGENVPALEFAGLFKRFGDNVAVDHIDLTVPAGSFFGLAGPNGSGKTTSLILRRPVSNHGTSGSRGRVIGGLALVLSVTVLAAGTLLAG